MSRVRPVDRLFRLRQVERELTVLVDADRAAIEQVVHLQRHPFRVRGVQAEAQRAERGGEERHVHAAFLLLVDHALVHEVLQRPEPRDVRFRFFERTVQLLQLLAHGRLAAADADRLRTEAVHQLVHQDVREERLERDERAIRRRERDAAKSAPAPSRTSPAGNCVSSTRFEPFSATTRSSFGRLNAAVCTPWLPSPAANTTLTTRMGE